MAPSTFSIAACDLDAAEWGVAVQSKFLAVGAICAWAAAGVGAVATQAFANPAFGPDALALLGQGLDARAAVERLVAADEGRDRRQLGVVDGGGRAHAFTGAGCTQWAGHKTGPGWSVQGNILVSEATLAGMSGAFEASAGRPLAERLVGALEAGQAAGGDRRGQQSACLLVVRPGAGYGGTDRMIDLRVDDHPQPITELARLLDLHRLYFAPQADHEWLVVDGPLGDEIRDRLARLGYATGDLSADLAAWAGVENLEMRVRGADRIDPAVLAQLRKPG